MSNWQYTTDILQDVLERCGEKPDTSSDFYNIALRYINRAYLNICNGSLLDPVNIIDWHWARKTSFIILKQVIKIGTVSVTQNSANITFSIAPTDSLGNSSYSTFNRYLFKVDNHDDVFVIASHNGGDTGAILDSVYTGATVANASYKVFKIEYILQPDVVRLLAPMEVFQASDKVSYIELERFEDKYPIKDISDGKPYNFTIVQDNTVRFNTYCDSDEYIRVDYSYIYQPALLTGSTNEEPIIPLRFRSVLSDIAAYYIFMDKNDDRADAAIISAKSTFALMVQDNDRWLTRVGNNVGKVITRQQYPRGITKKDWYRHRY